jgi:hypothetical protein
MKDLRMTRVGKICSNAIVVKMLLSSIRGRPGSVAS